MISRSKILHPVRYAWKERYIQELAKSHLKDKPEVGELPAKKRGHHLMLGADIDKQVEL